MKYIKKGKEPVEFTEWKDEDKMYQHDLPNWNRLKSSLREIIKDSLIAEQGGFAVIANGNCSKMTPTSNTSNHNPNSLNYN